MRCFSDIVNGVWVFVEQSQKCMPQKDVPCNHPCEKCPRDVDECADGSHDCKLGQTCINHIGVAPGREADRASFQVKSMLETKCVGDNYEMLATVLTILITIGDSSTSIIFLY